jgi:hypothetical protein
VHEGLTVVTARDEQLGDLGLHAGARISGGEVVELTTQIVQFLNFRRQAHTFYMIPLVPGRMWVSGTSDPAFLDYMGNRRDT